MMTVCEKVVCEKTPRKKVTCRENVKELDGLEDMSGMGRY